jgi:CO/xanthine dehydrogenase FAD-binding subunit
VKPAAFEYHDPTSLAEALLLLARFGDGARPLAGGQSLVPLMNLRLIRPLHLVDLNGVGELRYLKLDNGELRIGAMTRQRQLERSAEVENHWPLLREATKYIGHIQVRNRGTVGGSLAHAFPSAELPVAFVALGASLVLRRHDGERTVGAEEFFVSHMTTILQPDELLIEIRVPALPPKTGWSFQEVSRRHGDFALAGVAALVTLDGGGSIGQARLSFTGPTALRVKKVEQLLVGEKATEGLFREVARAATQDLAQDSDIHASGDYRRHASEVLARRALEEAARRALQLKKGAS